MAKTAILPLATYQAGERSLPEANVPTGITRVQVAFDLTHLSTLTLIMAIALELSQDNGQTWIAWGGCGLDLPKSGYTLVGSTPHDDQNVAVPESRFGIALPNPNNVQRKLRGSISLSEAFTTSVTVDLT